MANYIYKALRKLVLAETSVKKLTLSFCVGAFLAFSPYLGLQTWLTFPLCWLFGLNITVMLGALYLISNPFTMVPIIIAGYAVGQYLLVDLLHLNIIAHNPQWLDKAVKFLAKHVIDLEKYVGSKICFWCYMIGAHILAILVALVLYPIMKRIFAKLILEADKEKIDESNCPK